MAGRIIHNKPGVAHSFYPPLKVHLSPLDFLLLVIDTSAGEKIEHEKDQSEDDHDTDWDVIIDEKDVSTVISFLTEIDQARRVSSQLVVGRRVSLVWSDLGGREGRYDRVVGSGRVGGGDDVGDELVPDSDLVGPVVTADLHLRTKLQVSSAVTFVLRPLDGVVVSSPPGERSE